MIACYCTSQSRSSDMLQSHMTVTMNGKPRVKGSISKWNGGGNIRLTDLLGVL